MAMAVMICKGKRCVSDQKISRSLFNHNGIAYLTTLIIVPITNHLRVISLIEQVRKERLPGEAMADLMGRSDLGRLSLGSPAQIWLF
jgi:hypothetical protein